MLFVLFLFVFDRLLLESKFINF